MLKRESKLVLLGLVALSFHSSDPDNPDCTVVIPRQVCKLGQKVVRKTKPNTEVGRVVSKVHLSVKTISAIELAVPEGGDEGVRPLLVSPRAGREDLRERGQSRKLMQKIIKDVTYGSDTLGIACVEIP